MLRVFEDVAIGKGLLQKFSASQEIVPGTDGLHVCRIKASVQCWDNQQSRETTTEWGGGPAEWRHNHGIGGDRQSGETACRMGMGPCRIERQPQNGGNRQSGETVCRMGGGNQQSGERVTESGALAEWRHNHGMGGAGRVERQPQSGAGDLQSRETTTEWGGGGPAV